MGIIDSALEAATCGNCRWWRPDRRIELGGYCRRQSPAPDPNPNLEGARWPFTAAEDYCGEHERA